jgi:site-specific DNA recombinase
VGRDERERVRLERHVQALEGEVQRLIDAYQVGAITLTELQDRRRRSEEHHHVLTDRLQELHRQRYAREQEIRLLQGLEGFCANLREALADPSFAVKQKVLQLVVDRIIVEDTQLVIRHVIPTGSVGLQPRHHHAKKLRQRSLKQELEQKVKDARDSDDYDRVGEILAELKRLKDDSVAVILYTVRD